jgi:dynein light intermediate chain 2
MVKKSYSKCDTHVDRMKIRPLLMPSLIVGWKYDLFAKNLDVEVRKWIARGLRYIAHLNGASLVFGSENDPTLVRQGI